jgi:hypothetical protein
VNVTCEHCGGKGYSRLGHHPEDTEPEDARKCAWCAGKGYVVTEGR